MSNRPFKARNAFHPADPPHGMQNYDVGALTRDQKQALNKMKMTTRKENEIYFKSHPEIRGLVGILLRHVLSKQPLIDIHEVVGTFFNRPRREIVADLLDYLSSADKRSDITDDLRREIFRTRGAHGEICWRRVQGVPRGEDSSRIEFPNYASRSHRFCLVTQVALNGALNMRALAYPGGQSRIGFRVSGIVRSYSPPSAERHVSLFSFARTTGAGDRSGGWPREQHQWTRGRPLSKKRSDTLDEQ
ncbi:hypothetical protein ALC57_04251 [Trachymyrmex cornetzi]|uniref:Uncharacterized protein n=1 Tax=Trachymyrmex cornetzi TaxID=471704 RepID=A0A195EEZ6_9HYME|nr:hypothetical protein ALC57_04251 [Trachymyrmex cornetzi]